jgi:DNA-binding NarL/FixJ family response regulator
MRDQPGYITDARRAGARGYVLKEQAFGDLIDAIRAVGAGRTFVSQDLAGRLSAERIRGGGWDRETFARRRTSDEDRDARRRRYVGAHRGSA